MLRPIQQQMNKIKRTIMAPEMAETSAKTCMGTGTPRWELVSSMSSSSSVSSLVLDLLFPADGCGTDTVSTMGSPFLELALQPVSSFPKSPRNPQLITPSQKRLLAIQE